MRDITFGPDDKVLPYVHVLDLQKSGCVKAHIDSARVSRLQCIYLPLLELSLISHLLNIWDSFTLTEYDPK